MPGTLEAAMKSLSVGSRPAQGILLFVCLVSARYETELYVTRQEMIDFVGTSHAKLVYTNQENGYAGTNVIEYIDFSDDQLTIRRLGNVASGCLPVVSPDGDWVVFTDTYRGEHGKAGKSNAYVCRLDPDAQPALLAQDIGNEPRFVFDPSALGDGYDPSKLWVIFPTQSPAYAWEGRGKTMVVEVDTSGEIPEVGTPRVLLEHGSYTGGISYDGRYLCGGGGTIAKLDLHGGSVRPDTIGPYLYGTNKQFTRQACNASVSSSRKATDAVMFLDFGNMAPDQTPALNGGAGWKTWGVVFIATSTTDLLRHFTVPRYHEEHPYEIPNPVPEDTIRLDRASTVWHHPEWSNHPYFAAATINVRRLWGSSPEGGMIQVTEKHERICFLDLRENSYTGRYLQVLGAGESELQYDSGKNANGVYWPYLWVEVPEGFEEEAWDENLPARNPRPTNRDYSANGPVAVVHKEVVTSVVPIRHIEVFGVRGRLIRSTQLETPSRTAYVGDVPGGAWFLRITTVAGQSGMLLHVREQ